MKAVKYTCNNLYCTSRLTFFAVDPNEYPKYNFYCHCGAKMIERRHVDITETSPTYRLVMHGLDHQFRYSKTTFDSYDDAKEAAAQASFAWGYPVKVEEVSE